MISLVRKIEKTTTIKIHIWVHTFFLVRVFVHGMNADHEMDVGSMSYMLNNLLSPILIVQCKPRAVVLKVWSQGLIPHVDLN